MGRPDNAAGPRQCFQKFNGRWFGRFCKLNRGVNGGDAQAGHADGGDAGHLANSRQDSLQLIHRAGGGRHHGFRTRPAPCQITTRGINHRLAGRIAMDGGHMRAFNTGAIMDRLQERRDGVCCAGGIRNDAGRFKDLIISTGDNGRVSMVRRAGNQHGAGPGLQPGFRRLTRCDPARAFQDNINTREIGTGQNRGR